MTMTRLPHSVRTRGTSATRRPYWLLFVLAVSVSLHLLAVGWLGDTLRMPQASAPKEAVVLASLHTLPPPAPKPAPKPKAHRPVKRKAAPAPPSPSAAPATEEMPAPVVANEAATADDEASEANSPASAPAANNATSDAAGESNAPQYRIDLPPSAALEYDVQKTVKDGQPMYGHGSIKWQTDGKRYTVDGEAGVLFFTVLHFRSEGDIDDYGVSPELYSEKRMRKSETATHFHRERNTISFSASTRSYPRKGGEQDRASVIWQLAGIGRGDSTHFTRGASIDLMVAGTRDLDTWRMVVVGQEAIDIAGETVLAWHVTRTPRPGSYDEKLDIWLAPGREWYPLRLRYTETNGDYLDMSLSKLNVLTQP
jgi:hypothetical protein